MTKSGKVVKLMMYRHANEEIIIDSFSATDWGDFLLVSINGEQLTDQAYTELQDVFGKYSQQTSKQILLVPDDWNIEFYGVEVEEDAPKG